MTAHKGILHLKVNAGVQEALSQIEEIMKKTGLRILRFKVVKEGRAEVLMETPHGDTDIIYITADDTGITFDLKKSRLFQDLQKPLQSAAMASDFPDSPKAVSLKDKQNMTDLQQWRDSWQEEYKVTLLLLKNYSELVNEFYNVFAKCLTTFN